MARRKGDKILKAIQTAVSQGRSVESHYYLSKFRDKNELEDDHFFCIRHSQNLVSVFTAIESWCKEHSSIKKIEKGVLMSAIFQGGRNR